MGGVLVCGWNYFIKKSTGSRIVATGGLYQPGQLIEIQLIRARGLVSWLPLRWCSWWVKWFRLNYLQWLQRCNIFNYLESRAWPCSLLTQIKHLLLLPTFWHLNLLSLLTLGWRVSLQHCCRSDWCVWGVLNNIRGHKQHINHEKQSWSRIICRSLFI